MPLACITSWQVHWEKKVIFSFILCLYLLGFVSGKRQSSKSLEVKEENGNPKLTTSAPINEEGIQAAADAATELELKWGSIESGWLQLEKPRKEALLIMAENLGHGNLRVQIEVLVNPALYKSYKFFKREQVPSCRQNMHCKENLSEY